MDTTLAAIDPVPWAIVDQARRRRELKAALLRTGAMTVPALADAWGTKVPAARKRVERYRRDHLIFTVKRGNELLVPGFLFTADLEPRAELQPAVDALRGAGDDGWSLWAWFARPSGWLDGDVPAEVAALEPERVVDAAQRRAAASAA